MFERFGDHARSIVVHANEESLLMGNAYVAPEHLLLAMLSADLRNQATEILSSLGVKYSRAQEAAEDLGLKGNNHSRGHRPCLPVTVRVIEAAWGEATGLGMSYVRPEHLLLALLRPLVAPGSPELTDAAKILQHLGHEPATVRRYTLDWFYLAHPELIVGMDLDQMLVGTSLTPTDVMAQLGRVLQSSQDLVALRLGSWEPTAGEETVQQAVTSMYEKLQVPGLVPVLCIKYALLLQRLVNILGEIGILGRQATYPELAQATPEFMKLCLDGLAS